MTTRLSKSDLVAHAAAIAGVSDHVARQVLDAAFTRIADVMAEGGIVAITDFGAFISADRPAQTLRNPKTGETMVVPARKVPKFSASNGLKDRLKNAAPLPAQED